METLQQAKTPRAEFRPPRKIRILLLLPIVLLSAFFGAPVGIITIFKIQSFALLGPYWIILLGLSGASLFAKKDFYWMIYAVLAILTVLNAAGGLKFFGSMKGWH